MDETNKGVKCKYKKPCTAKDWPEHEYKCETCKWNKLCKAEKKINWPKLFLMSGWF